MNTPICHTCSNFLYTSGETDQKQLSHQKWQRCVLFTCDLQSQRPGWTLRISPLRFISPVLSVAGVTVDKQSKFGVSCILGGQGLTPVPISGYFVTSEPSLADIDSAFWATWAAVLSPPHRCGLVAQSCPTLLQPHGL